MKHISIAMLTTIALFACKSTEKHSLQLQSYCDVADEMLASGRATTRTGLLNAPLIFDTWRARTNPDDATIEAIDSFHGRKSNYFASEAPVSWSLERFKEMMAASASEMEMEPPRCDALLKALLESEQRADKLNFVDHVCVEYGIAGAETRSGSYDPAAHDGALRGALNKVIARTKHVNEEGRAFVSALLSLPSTARGRSFRTALLEWRGFEFGPGDPCLDLQLDVEHLYIEHLEKQGIETP